MSDDGAQILVVAHRFGAAGRTPIEVPLPPGRNEVSDLYSHREIVVKLTKEQVAVELDEPFSAAALLLRHLDIDKRLKIKAINGQQRSYFPRP